MGGDQRAQGGMAGRGRARRGGGLVSACVPDGVGLEPQSSLQATREPTHCMS